MPGSSSNSSFIPKRGTTKRTRKVRNANIYILSIASYVLLFASIAASAGVYFYSDIVSNQLDNEIIEIGKAVEGFKEADMKRVEEFDVRLRQANQRLNNSASVLAVLSAVESAIIDTVRFNNFSLTRNLDGGYIGLATIETDTFDSSMFQRDVFGDREVVEAIEISNVALTQSINESNQSVGQSVSFVASLAVPLSAVSYTVEPAQQLFQESVPEIVSDTPATDTDAEPASETEELEVAEVNQDGV